MSNRYQYKITVKSDADSTLVGILHWKLKQLTGGHIRREGDAFYTSSGPLPDTVYEGYDLRYLESSGGFLKDRIVNNFDDIDIFETITDDDFYPYSEIHDGVKYISLVDTVEVWVSSDTSGSTVNYISYENGSWVEDIEKESMDNYEFQSTDKVSV